MGSNSFFRQLMIVMFSNPKPKSRNVKQNLYKKTIYIPLQVLGYSKIINHSLYSPKMHKCCLNSQDAKIHCQKFIHCSVQLKNCCSPLKQKFRWATIRIFFWLKSYSSAAIQCIIKISSAISTTDSDKHD